MKKGFVVTLLVCILWVTMIGFSQAQEPELIIAPPPEPELYQVPMQILVGLVGKYMAMAQQYQNMLAQGGAPETAIEFRLAAKVVVTDRPANTDLDAVLAELSDMAFWVNVSVFGRYASHFRVNLSGTLGDVEVVSTPEGVYVIARDEAVYTTLARGADIANIVALIPIEDMLPESFVGIEPDFFTSLELLQEWFTKFLLTFQSKVAMDYDGLELTPEGMAHVVRLTFTETGEVVSLWVLDETWDLYRIDVDDPAGEGGSMIIIVDNVELVSPGLPEATFDADIDALAEIPYDEFVALIGMKALTVVLTGPPVAADLALSLAEVRQGEQVIVRSDGLDAEDAESDLVAQIEYRAPGGSWTPLVSSYVGTAPLGRWEAVFVPSVAELPGSYDFRVTYTDSDGIASDPLGLLDALNVIAVPPQIVNVTPKAQAKDVAVSAQVVVAFSQGMDKASVESAFSLVDAAGKTVSGSFGWAGNVLTFTPGQNLKYGVRYSAKIRGTASGLNNVALGADFVWSFTTKYAPLPKVSSVSPADAQRGVPVSAQIAVTFTEPMDQVSVENAFSLTSAGQAIVGSFQWLGNTMTFIPAQKLNYNTTCSVRVAGSASSLLGMGLDANRNGVAEGTPKDDLSWSFSTEIFPAFAVNPASQSVLAGDFVSVNIVAEAVSRLVSFALTVDYDPAVLDLLKVERRSFVDWRPRPKNIQNVDVWQPIVIDSKQGLITIAVESTRTGGVSGTGVLATLTFRANGVGESPIQLKDVSAVNAVGEAMPFGLSDGSVKVLKFSPWDANHDGVVNVLDFVAIQSGRGATADVNGDGVVDINDMIAAAGNAQASPALAPEVSEMYDAYPNPFNPETWIPYQLAVGADVAVRIYSATGQLVRTMHLGYKHAGRYVTKSAAAHWDGTNDSGERVASGIYYLNINAGDFSAVKKVVILD